MALKHKVVKNYGKMHYFNTKMKLFLTKSHLISKWIWRRITICRLSNDNDSNDDSNITDQPSALGLRTRTTMFHNSSPILSIDTVNTLFYRNNINNNDDVNHNHENHKMNQKTPTLYWLAYDVNFWKVNYS